MTGPASSNSRSLVLMFSSAFLLFPRHFVCARQKKKSPLLRPAVVRQHEAPDRAAVEAAARRANGAMSRTAVRPAQRFAQQFARGFSDFLSFSTRGGRSFSCTMPRVAPSWMDERIRRSRIENNVFCAKIERRSPQKEVSLLFELPWIRT